MKQNDNKASSATQLTTSILEMCNSGSLGIQDVEYEEPVTGQKKKLIESLSIDINKDSKVTVVFGDNSSGKSLVANMIESRARMKNIPTRSVSMKNRTAGGIQSALIFGDESSESTGAMSVRTVGLGFKSAQNDGDSSVLILDEPDIGLSSRYTRAMGKLIAKNVNESPQEDFQVIVISHSERLLEGMLSDLCVPPSYIGINTSLTLSDWVSGDMSEASIEELEQLDKLGQLKKRAVVSALRG